jgi:hypothetical protein
LAQPKPYQTQTTPRLATPNPATNGEQSKFDLGLFFLALPAHDPTNAAPLPNHTEPGQATNGEHRGDCTSDVLPCLTVPDLTQPDWTNALPQPNLTERYATKP